MTLPGLARFLFSLLVLAAAAFPSGCSRRERVGHAVEQRAPEPPPPTPDTTPIPALRTPAGLVLGVEVTPAPVTSGAGGAASPPSVNVTTPAP